MDESLDSMDLVWRALADGTRRAVMDLLRDGPKTTGWLAGRFPDLTRFGVMKHLTVLEEAGLVIAEKRGRERWNHLNAVPLKRVYDRWVSKYEDQWAGSLLRLKDAAEKAAQEQAMSHKLEERSARVAKVMTDISINASRETVYRAWCDDTTNWFFNDEAGKSTSPAKFEEKLGGKFYMDLGDRGFNVLAEVTMIKKNEKIRLRGDCTCPEAFIANMTVSFTDEDGGTKVTIDHQMAGDFPDDYPAEFEEGWADGLAKLKTLVESGSA